MHKYTQQETQLDYKTIRVGVAYKGNGTEHLSLIWFSQCVFISILLLTVAKFSGHYVGI